LGSENSMLKWMMDLAYKYGYLGAFLASLLGNASIVIPAPYALFVFMLGALLDLADLPLLAFVSGLGAAIGELTGYVLGAAWRKALDEEKKRKLEKARKLLEKPAFLLIILMAATPLPDDVISLPLGLMRYPLWKAFPAFLIGKVALCLLLAYSGKLAFTTILVAFEGGGIWAMVGTAVAMVVIAVLLVLMDWDIMLEVIEQRGWRGLLSPSFMKRMLLSTGHKFRRKEKEGKKEGEGVQETAEAGEERKESEKESPKEGQ